MQVGMSTFNAVARFAAAGIVATAVISIGAYWVVSRNAVSEAIRNGQEIAAIDGRDVVAPALTDAVLAGEPASRASFDQLVRARILTSRVVRVKIWSPQGEVVYSDLAALVGQTFPLRDEERAAITGNRIAAEVSELNRPENRYERPYGRLLEVYLPIESPTGATYLFETYQVYSSIDQDQQRIWSAFFPALLAGLVLLLAVQVPLAWTLARSLQRALLDREALLKRSIEISALERRRIARDLHDGVVQELAGAAYALDAQAATARSTAPAVTDVMRNSARLLRHAVRELRSLIFEIAPPDLAGSRLESALSDLLAPLTDAGLAAHLETHGLKWVDGETAGVVFRTAQEALRNVAAHADASEVKVVVTADDAGTEVEVKDDGRGFTAEEVLRRQRDGHVGMAMLKTLVEDAGGRLTIWSMPGRGTSIRATFTRRSAS